MAIDPKQTLEAILDGVTALIDDGVTAASILVHYDGGNDTWFELFDDDDYDVVIELKDGRYKGGRFIQNDPVERTHFYTVSVCTIDKYDSTPTLVATGSKLQYKVQESMNGLIEPAAQGSQYIIEVDTGQPNNIRVAGRYLYVNAYTIQFKETF